MTLSSESHFWQKSRAELLSRDKSLGLWRVEDRTDTGFGDVLVSYGGITTWLELKFVRTMTRTETFYLDLRPNQPIFGYEWTVKGGTYFVVAEVKDLGYFMFRCDGTPDWIKDIRGQMHRNHRLVTFFSADKELFYDQLTSVLVR